MEEIRFIELDENYLILESPTGERMRLPNDDILRRALRRAPVEKLDSSNLSPRDIQQRIRAGSSVADVSAESGLSETLIEKFAGPVLDEIRHIIETAKAVRLSVSSERPNVSEHAEFGFIIESKLRASSAESISWKASKRESGGWSVAVDFKLDKKNQSAIWVFEPRRLSLAPDNDMAVQLSTEPKVEERVPASLKVAPAIAPEPSTLAPETPAEPEVETNATINLLDALQRKREARDLPAEAGSLAKPESELTGEQTSETDALSEPEAQIKKGRASMPSWDQIVFGTKAED